MGLCGPCDTLLGGFEVVCECGACIEKLCGVMEWSAGENPGYRLGPCRPDCGVVPALHVSACATSNVFGGAWVRALGVYARPNIEDHTRMTSSSQAEACVSVTK